MRRKPQGEKPARGRPETERRNLDLARRLMRWTRIDELSALTARVSAEPEMAPGHEGKPGNDRHSPEMVRSLDSLSV